MCALNFNPTNQPHLLVRALTLTHSNTYAHTLTYLLTYTYLTRAHKKKGERGSSLSENSMDRNGLDPHTQKQRIKFLYATMFPVHEDSPSLLCHGQSPMSSTYHPSHRALTEHWKALGLSTLPPTGTCAFAVRGGLRCFVNRSLFIHSDGRVCDLTQLCRRLGLRSLDLPRRSRLHLVL